MQRLVFEPTHELIFTQNGLKTIEEFIGYTGGQTINQNQKRDVTVLRLDTPDGEKVYYMKRFFSPHPKDMLFAFRSLGRLCSQAELEWRNARLLLENGIETYRPACWGALTCCGIERRSFFITQKIDGRSLIEIMVEQWDGFDAARRRWLVGELARFFSRLHNARLSLPDAYIWHLFVMEPIQAAGPYRFAMIDLHRMHSNASGWRWAVRNLAALLSSVPDEWFDADLRELFVTTYLDDSAVAETVDRKTFFDALDRRQTKIIARRQKPSLERLKKMV